MKLSEEQEEIVRKYVEEYNLKLRTLSDDIIDHLCCVLESELGKGKSFDQVLHDAITELAPQGIIDLQRKTFYLLNSKRIIVMKKLTYLTGFTGSISLTSGAAFKLLHLPGADQLFMLGYIVFLLIFVPLLAVDRSQASTTKSQSERWKIILGLTSSIMLGVAGVFKLAHFQGAHLLLMSGIIIFAMGFLPFLFFTMYKRSVS
ncbi:MAG: hypothetical protein AAF694_02675 [Bacteroidota bacterium]